MAKIQQKQQVRFEVLWVFYLQKICSFVSFADNAIKSKFGNHDLFVQTVYFGVIVKDFDNFWAFEISFH